MYFYLTAVLEIYLNNRGQLTLGTGATLDLAKIGACLNGKTQESVSIKSTVRFLDDHLRDPETSSYIWQDFIEKNKDIELIKRYTEHV